MRYWILKSEPDEYGIEHLRKDKISIWTGIRNYQARKYIQQMQPGDLAFFYHSSCKHPGIYGLMKIVRAAFLDPTLTCSPSVEWLSIEVSFQEQYEHPVLLAALKSDPRLAQVPLLKQSRLSTSPLTTDEASIIFKLVKHQG